jgi:hypothetical protein
LDEFEQSTLWRISAFERLKNDPAHAQRTGDGPTLLPSTLLSDLARLDRNDPSVGADVLDVMAACMRHRESALIYLQRGEHVWPVTLFPRELVYHCPFDLLGTCGADLSGFRILSVEPAGVRPPGHLVSDRVAAASRYRPLLPLLWQMALSGPRSELLPEIGGAAAYRLSPGFELFSLPLTGASRLAYDGLRTQTASLRAMSGWTGMDLPRARRLLNALYLVSGLMVLRTHPAAREEPGTPSAFMGWLRGGRR